jgi:hypothetical protein
MDSATPGFPRDERSRIFDALRNMFVEAGKEFSRQLVDESYLPVERRTLKPDRAFGGVAGGKKFRKGNQLFKFAQDVEWSPGHWVYGGDRRDDRAAMKSAGHEIKATQALIDAGMMQLNYPLMAAFTYRTKRVLCMSLLPVKGKATLIQGKDDAKDAVRVPPEHVEAIMATMGANLRIAKSCKPGEEIYGPWDMEIHQGEDGLLYMIDAARLMPPEYRHGAAHPGPKQMYQLLRPELLRKVGIPLVPDALRGAYGDAKAEVCLREVSSMLDVEIKQLAQELEAGQHHNSLSCRVNFKSLIHERGLNMRHVPEVIAAMAVGSSSRTQLQALLEVQRAPGKLDVKTVEAPRPLNADQVYAVLKLQSAALKDGMPKLQQVPTLLQLALLVPPPALIDGGLLYPFDNHPLGEAFELCAKFDPVMEVERGFVGPEVFGCSAAPTLPVLFEMARNGTWKDRLVWSNLERVVGSHASSSLHPQLKRSLERHRDGLGLESPVQVAMQHAARLGEWTIVRSWSAQYNGEVEALLVAAELGNVEWCAATLLSRQPKKFWRRRRVMEEQPWLRSSWRIVESGISVIPLFCAPCLDTRELFIFWREPVRILTLSTKPA